MEIFRHLFFCDQSRWSTHEFGDGSSDDSRKDKRSITWTSGQYGYSNGGRNPSGHHINGQINISRKRRRIKITDLPPSSNAHPNTGVGGGGGRDRKYHRSMKNSWGRKWTGSSNNSSECDGEWGAHDGSSSSMEKTERNLSTRSIYMLVILISIASYWNSFNGDFVHDDLSAIKTNGDVTGQNRIWDIFLNDFWGKPMADQTSHKSYRPLTILSFR